MPSALIIGGTRNLGHFSAIELLRAGWRVTVLNRGRTPDELPRDIERLRADRTDSAQLRAALRARDFDAVIDMALYTGVEARQAVELLEGRTGRYVFISSGQVYLVRSGLARPYREEDHGGPVIPVPPRGSVDHDQWCYGMGKREAEDVFAEAWSGRGFPFTSLRLPMVLSERDHYGRVQAYLARLDDGGPILIPDQEDPPLRPVYVKDIAALLPCLLAVSTGIGRAYNLAQPHPVKLSAALATIAEIAGRDLPLLRVPRADLDERRLLPACSPFSGRWLSELDTRRAVGELGVRYTDLTACLSAIIENYRAMSDPRGKIPPGYEQRAAELGYAGPAGGTDETRNPEGSPER